MDLTELLAVATDCTYGEIEKILLYEQTAADYENFDKRVEFTDFEMVQIDGAKIEMMSQVQNVSRCTFQMWYKARQNAITSSTRRN